MTVRKMKSEPLIRLLKEGEPIADSIIDACAKLDQTLQYAGWTPLFGSQPGLAPAPIARRAIEDARTSDDPLSLLRAFHLCIRHEIVPPEWILTKISDAFAGYLGQPAGKQDEIASVEAFLGFPPGAKGKRSALRAFRRSARDDLAFGLIADYAGIGATAEEAAEIAEHILVSEDGAFQGLAGTKIPNADSLRKSWYALTERQQNEYCRVPRVDRKLPLPKNHRLAFDLGLLEKMIAKDFRAGERADLRRRARKRLK